MYELPLNLDQKPEWVPPLGKWRVLDYEWWDGVKATFVSDADTLGSAMDLLQLARHPNTRTIINDMGVVVATFTPGSIGVPKAGAES